MAPSLRGPQSTHGNFPPPSSSSFQPSKSWRGFIDKTDDVARCHTMQIYIFLWASLRRDRVQIIVSISCLVSLESSGAIEHDLRCRIYVTLETIDYRNKKTQESWPKPISANRKIEFYHSPDSQPWAVVFVLCANLDFLCSFYQSKDEFHTIYKKYRKRNKKPLISGTADMTAPRCLNFNGTLLSDTF